MIYPRSFTLSDILSFLRDPRRALKILLHRADYLQFLSEVTGFSIAELKKQLPSGRTKHLLRRYVKSTTPYGSISWEIAMILYMLVRIYKPKVVIETGIGRSSIFILCVLYDNKSGKLYSIDYDPLTLRIVPKELRERWFPIVGLSRSVLPHLLSEIGAVDIFFHDSDHSYENMMFEYNSVWPYLKENGLLLSHDVDLNSAFEDFSKKVHRPINIFGRKYMLGIIIK